MTESILESIKKNRGINAEYTVFDQDIIMAINAAFSTLTQLGCGPNTGFRIEDDSAVWDDMDGEKCEPGYGNGSPAP